MFFVIRFIGALIGFFFGFSLGRELLQLGDVREISNQVTVVLLLAVACAILGWLGAPYATIAPARAVAARIRAASAADLAAGALGLAIGLLLGLFLAFPLSFLPGELGRFAPIVVAAVLGAAGMAAGTIKREDLVGLLRDLRGGRRDQTQEQRVLLDTSVIIDGRIADVVRAGFVRGTLLLPRFILAELQFFADSSDGSKRERGRRGLEMLARMQKEATVRVELLDDDPANATGADAKLVVSARALGVPIMTNDYGLNRVAELQGVSVLNMNDLAKAVRPVVLPGEDITLRVIQEGKEPGQGVGYLEDGTMIVIENGVRHLGTDLTVTVMRVLQTVGGRMIFAQPKGEVEQRRPRAIGRD
ncbi:MAG TPA: PIN domain-containing protein [Candidatus Limnocylindrales bacterium]|nr:PIN domain-containing protein [Candidatus Limnocylindrales bacterium]